MLPQLYRAEQALAQSGSSRWPTLIGVDEGRDQLFRWTAGASEPTWSRTLESKCRSLQVIGEGRFLAVHDGGCAEFDVETGDCLSDQRIENGGVVSAIRELSGGTVFAGLNFGGVEGISFIELDRSGQRRRSLTLSGDYVRCCSTTPQDTLLYTANTVVHETDWSGRHLGRFQAPGFYHAWKALRLSDGTTLISAGYGAFLARFDIAGKETQRWTVPAEYRAEIRPFFFGDFSVLPNGQIVVCNWLGHGVDRGGTGYALLEFAPSGEFIGAWRDSVHLSSLQTFVFC